MNEKSGSITCEQLVSHIEKNYKRLDPINSICNIQLYDYQKYIIKQILTGNTLTMTSRQMGLTSVYAWFASAMAQLQRETRILFVLPSINNIKNINKIININKYTPYHSHQNAIVFSNFSTISLTRLIDLPIITKFDYIFGQFYQFNKNEFKETITLITPLSNNINISFNKPKEWNNEYLKNIWSKSLIQQNNFKAIYLPWYLQTNRKQNFQKEHKEYIGQLQFNREFLA